MPVNIACKLDPVGRQERQQVLGRLLVRAAERRDLDAGYTLVFPADSVTLTEVEAVIEPERRCCPFLRFVLAVEPEGGPISLDLTGPDGTKGFLKGLLSLD